MTEQVLECRGNAITLLNAWKHSGWSPISHLDYMWGMWRRIRVSDPFWKPILHSADGYDQPWFFAGALRSTWIPLYQCSTPWHLTTLQFGTANILTLPEALIDNHMVCWCMRQVPSYFNYTQDLVLGICCSCGICNKLVGMSQSGV
jgi:hypothetical protein